jgi:phosphatidylglycerol lysyltransferase
VVEVAHFMNGLIGLCLLIIVPALRRRLDSAWLVLLALLGAGVVSSLLKGFDYEEALFLAAGFVFFWPCRERFYRRGHLLNQAPDLTWSTVMVFALLATIWLGFYSYRRVPYHEDVWWTAAIHADAPRFLRSSVGLVVAAVALGIWQLCAPHRPKLALPSEQDLRDAARIVQQESRTSPHLALVGDKSLFFSESRQAFLAYAIEGRTWVVMGDPVGLEEDYAELIWDFREHVDRYAGRAVFYEVGAEFFPLYVDQGYSLLKLGEEARVWLPSFSLAGPESKQFRQARSRMARENCRFEIVPAERVAELLPQLQRISDEWLDAKNAAEKGFSLGYFDPDYLQRCPLAVVWRGEEVVAFANLWLVESKEELSMDLMRHAADAPSGAMEFLIVELLLWGQAEGYRWFNLGMAPLSGLENRPLSPLWNKVLQLVYDHGQRFYSFVGLRNYKEKFDPQWTPRYLASFGGWELPGILADVTRLIARKRVRSKLDTVTTGKTGSD